MPKKPLVSILIASFNKEKYVKRCIESCLKQNYKNIEIIFYDDGSKDNSLKIAKRFKKIKIISNKKKKFLSKFNTYPQINSYCEAFKRSKGNIISFLDSDDFYKRNKVKEIVDHFIKNKRSNIVFDKPIFFYTKDITSHPFKNVTKNFNKNIWPKFPPQSCISIKRNVFKKYIKDIKNKNFSMLTLDFRLAVIANTILDDFFIIDKNLTYYFQNIDGESLTKFKKFGYNWWIRRSQAHSYMKYISSKYKINYNINLDYLITKFIASFVS